MKNTIVGAALLIAAAALANTPALGQRIAVDLTCTAAPVSGRAAPTDPQVRTCDPVTATARRRVGTCTVGTGRHTGLDGPWPYTYSTGADPQTASTTDMAAHVGETIES
jgi:hypothetical protein